MGDRDKWRHVRAVLAARTPHSELLVHRAGGEIVAVVGEVMARVLVLRVPEGVPQARADADLDALSVLWNTADELLADAERGARTPATERSPDLARERRRVAALRGGLVEIKRLTDAASEATMTRSTLDLAWRVGRIAERHMPVTMEEADAPGQGAEGSDHGH